MKTRSYLSIFRSLLVLSVLFLGVSTGAKSATVPHDMEFITTKLEHFHIHHTQEQEPFAQRYGYFLEKHLKELEIDLGWELKAPVDIVVNDRTDVSNAFAASFPYNKIMVYPIAYETEASVSEYFDWVEELAVHELTHIVANDSAFGGYTVLASIFGNAIRPNGIQPKWLIEGLAVFEETERTLGGRGRSTFTEAIMRTAVRRDLLNNEDYVTLPRLNDGVLWWPTGVTPYLFGYAIQTALEGHRERIHEVPKTATATQSIPGLISNGNASRFPFTLNNNLESIYKIDWNEAWLQLISKLQSRYNAEKDFVSGSCQLTQAGRFTGGASVAPDGWVYFIAHHPQTGRVLARMKKDAPCILQNRFTEYDPTQVKQAFEILVTGVEGGGGAKVAVNSDGTKVAFAMLTPSNSRSFYDLYLYDVASKKTERLTRGLRARDPAFSVDGKSLAFVRNLGNGKQALMLRDLGTNTDNTVFESKYFERISTPFLTQNAIYFSLHNNQGQEEIMVTRTAGANSYSPPKRAILGLTKGQQFVERHPFISKDGILYYSATYKKEDPTPDGLRAEIYAYSEGKGSKRLTWSESGLNLWPVPLTSREVLVASYTPSGLNLVRLDTQSIPSNITPSADSGRSLHAHLTRREDPIRHVSHDNDPPEQYRKIQAKSPYSTLSTPATSLWPQYWIPLFFSVNEGIQAGATTSGQDPLEQNRYFLLALYDSRASFPTYSVGYENTAHSIGFALLASQSNNYFSGSDSSNRNNSYSLEFSRPFWGLGFGFGGGYQQRRLGRFSANHAFAFVSVSKNTVSQSPLAIAANDGYLLSSYVALYPESDGEDTFIDFRPSAGLFLPGLYHSHSMQLSVKGAFSTNKLLASNYFQGGGPTIGLNASSSFIVRGYPEDTLFGQKITTANFSYTFPIARPYKGWDVQPIFFQTIGLRFLMDAGTAIGIARYSGDTFRFYQGFSLADQFIFGTGMELLVNGTMGYYAPTQFTLGIHQGLNKDFGGETRFYVGLNVSVLTPGLSGKSYATPVQAKVD